MKQGCQMSKCPTGLINAGGLKYWIEIEVSLGNEKWCFYTTKTIVYAPVSRSLDPLIQYSINANFYYLIVLFVPNWMNPS
jgi:hypothetical protein